jgi:hypothetical protein
MLDMKGESLHVLHPLTLSQSQLNVHFGQQDMYSLLVIPIE